MSSITEDRTLHNFILENYPDEALLETLEEYAYSPEATKAISETPSTHSFREWIRSIRSSKASLPQGPSRFVTDWPEDEGLDDSYRMLPKERISGDDASFVTSSSFLQQCETASMSLASLSWAWRHAIQRYQIIQELIDTEVSYISILKNLSQGLSLVLIAPSGVHQSVDKLITFHERLLASLRNRPTVSTSNANLNTRGPTRRMKYANENDPNPSTIGANSIFLAPKKLRWQASPRIRSPTVLMATPKEAADVACILKAHLPGFLVYKEYLMKYPSVQSEIDQLRQTKQNWQAYDQGLEALFRTVQPFSSREKYANHARTIADLLIQCTPATQCLVTHETLRQAHQETVNVAQEVNSGSDDPIAIDRYRKTMELQKRLEFPSSQDYHDILKTYGPLKVCGVLHVAYQIGETVSGSYMVCALFDSYILLATSSSDREKFRVMAIIHIRGSRLEEPANGIGLHCSGTPYSWKLIFTFEHSLVELIFSACSEKEETEWLRNLIIQINPEQEARSETVGQPVRNSFIYFALKPLQAVILNGRLLSVARRSSIHGTLITTGSPDYLPIHIKGTTALPTNQATRPPLGRSQSVQNSRRDIVLAPKRQKRVKMEKRLVDIWTRDVVPYPGMPLGIGESFMRTSTDVLMGKFTSLPQFARRTNSNRISIKNNSVEQFSIPKSENHKMEAEDEDSINNSPTKETGQGQGDDKTGLQKAATDAPSTQRRGFMSLRKKHSNLVQRAIGEAPSEVRYKGSRQSLRKRLSVALFKSSSPGKSRRSNSVEA
ncbi:hypothetical protein CISG_09980 [Coccidioides immitis RMSCC 3703]|uniref:DH domain-containing protein n=1 Tax=Coccidioides immitis RMSCC 3703 TaxID=454286 RepID=A0A0J8THS7_COCIT|nr:hypothetical protein CISG_09980 [Coccidioides immitis RMSCC 3703]